MSDGLWGVFVWGTGCIVGAVHLYFCVRRQSSYIIGAGRILFTLRKAAFTVGLEINPLFQRFSMRSLLVAPELRQAMVLKGRDSGQGILGVMALRFTCGGGGSVARMSRAYLQTVATTKL